MAKIMFKKGQLSQMPKGTLLAKQQNLRIGRILPNQKAKV